MTNTGKEVSTLFTQLKLLLLKGYIRLIKIIIEYTLLTARVLFPLNLFSVLFYFLDVTLVSVIYERMNFIQCLLYCVRVEV